MAKDPAFLFYSQDFYTGVSTMTFEDRGKFISILCLMHQKGRLSEETISFIVGSVSVNLKSKFDIDENGLWFNKRLELETERRNNFTESRRNNGLLGGRGHKSKANGKPNAKAKRKHKDNLMENEDVNEIVNDNDTEIQKQLKFFFKFRRELKKPVLESSKEELKKKLIKLSGGKEDVAIEILKQSIANGWQGIFELKINQPNGL